MLNLSPINANYINFISVGGMHGYDALEGKIANFRMWDYELEVDQLNALSCFDEGNLVSQQYFDFTNTQASQLSSKTFVCGMLIWTH